MLTKKDVYLKICRPNLFRGKLSFCHEPFERHVQMKPMEKFTGLYVSFLSKLES